MKKIIGNIKRVPFKKVVVFNKEIETFKDGIEIDFDFINENLENSKIFNVVGVSHIYDNKLNPTEYRVRYELNNGKSVEYIENEEIFNAIAI